jgi:hypothetical protein
MYRNTLVVLSSLFLNLHTTTLQMEAAAASEISLPIHKTIQCHNAEDQS